MKNPLDNVILGEARLQDGCLVIICPLCGADCQGLSAEHVECLGISPHRWEIMGLGNNMSKLLMEATNDA